MKIGVAYSEPSHQVWLNLEVPDGTTVGAAIERSGILAQFPHIDLTVQKVGVFAKVVKLDTPLRHGDRVEIYRPITCDPKAVRKKADADDTSAKPEAIPA
ncbi:MULTISPECIES: RnfH family protein [Aromatoleum]|nr:MULTISPECIES: RnfH family protein [Aromatoleum]MCK0510275.1 RnfH family protein [Aromatoleum buckelii]NMG54795.1 RnfH family protein [Aromatoleum aromaticum]